MLTARTVGVPAPGDAQVVDIRVHPSQAVTKGSPLAVLKTFGTNSTGTVKTSRLTIKAPVSGVVSSLPSPVGSAVKRGDAIVQMYNPRRKSFEVPVDTSAVSRLRRGMHVKLTSPAISGWIPAVVDHVVAPIAGGSSEGGDGTTSTPSDGLTVVLRPRRADYVSGLTPGLQFSAVVDTDSAPARAPEVVRVVGS
jgi:multidrug resistance efflux pump